MALVLGRTGDADVDDRMIAAATVVMAALYVDMQCVGCCLYRHDHVREMNSLGKRSCPAVTGRGR
jgi:hypothetical protein